MHNVLVTGAAGYLGSALVGRLLQNGYRVQAIDNLARNIQPLVHFADNPNFTFSFGDVREERTLKPLIATADAIIALAAMVSTAACARDPRTAESVNLDSVRLLNRLRSDDQALIYPNTNIGYGAQVKEPIYDENSLLQPTSTYGLTKVAAEQAIADRGNFAAFRLASAFGPSPGMKTHLLLNYFVHRAVSDGYLVVYETGARRNFVHVRDICDCFIYCLANYTRMRNEVYNLGLDRVVTKGELVDMIKPFVPRLHVHHADFGADPDRRDYVVSNRKLAAAGFRATTGLETGIVELVRYFSMLPTPYE